MFPKNLDSETKEQVMPLLEAILQAQPTVNMKSISTNTNYNSNAKIKIRWDG